MVTEGLLRTVADMTELEHRFWAKVLIIDDDDSCWVWRPTRATHPNGYGVFQMTWPGESRSRAIYASRVALLLASGIPPNVACHHCDNPPCCRPSHLYDGSHTDNMADKARGRQRARYQRGEANAIAVLTEKIVTEARIAYRGGAPLSTIAEQHDVPRAALYQAVIGKSWTHLAEPPVDPGMRGHGKLSRAEIVTLRKLLRLGGHSRDELAAMFGIHPSAVSYHRRTMKLPDGRQKNAAGH